MDYEKKYKEALEWMQSLYDGLHGATKEDAEHYFPELKESEDEKIRKAILQFFELQDDNTTYCLVPKKDILAWLEKQGEKKYIINVPPREVILSIWDLGNEWKELTNGCISTEYGTQLDYIQKHWHESEYYLKEKQGEQKPDDNVAPKFKVGDWIVNNVFLPIQIASIKDSMYIFTKGDAMSVSFIDENFHLWTIQDAKDGDILYAKGSYFKEYVFKFSSFTEDNVISTHFGYDVFHGTFYTKLSRFGREEDFVFVNPATKEQRDLLFQKMKEAGYEWDAEKKELKKKIESKTLDADKVIAWLVANICDIEYCVKLFKKDFGL